MISNQRSGTLVLDFDSTISSQESLVELLKLSLRTRVANDQERSRVEREILRLTEQGNSGALTLGESLRLRLEIARPSLSALDTFHNDDRITFGMKEALDEFRSNFPNVAIHVLSGGPKCCVAPQCERLGIDPEFVHALNLDIDRWPMFRDDDALLKGKTYVLESLLQQGRIQQPIVIVGDSVADMLPRRNRVASYAIGFGVHVARDTVRDMCDTFVNSIEQLSPAIRQAFANAYNFCERISL